ncbi:EAL domain-containing protein [Alteromonas sp. H39]|uniref:EAL domain-containing protein n=1 Tax=Alteromonas sp. H39 TaxID=3389876 RepID=UPI0039E00C03
MSSISRLAVTVVFLFIIPLAGASQVRVPSPNFEVLSTKNGLTQDFINHIVIEDSGFVWVATEGGLVRWDGYRAEEFEGPDNVLTNASINKLTLEADEGLWISTFASGVYRFDFKSNQLEHKIKRSYREQPEWIQPANNFHWHSRTQLVVSLYEEVILYDTETNSIRVIFSLLDEALENAESIRYAISLDNRLFVATTEGLYSKVLDAPPQDYQRLDYLNGLPGNVKRNNAKYLLADPQGRFWVGAVDGLYMAPVDELKAYLDGNSTSPFKDIVRGKNIWTITQADNNAFWLGTNKGLFSLVNSDGQWETVYELTPDYGDTILPRKRITTITKDSDNNLWLGTEYGGALYYMPSTANVTTIQNRRTDSTPTLSNVIVWALHQGNDNTLWIGTDNGLNRYNLATGETDAFIVTENEDDGNGDSVIEKIMPWEEGTLLLQTYNGISIFDKSTGTLRKPQPTVGDAEIFNQWNYGSAVDAQGRAYFGSDKFYRFDYTTNSVEALALDPVVFDTDFFSSFLGTSAYYEDRMFVAMLNGLWLLDTETLEYELVYELPPEQRNTSMSVSSWALDQQGTLWLAFPRFGLLGLDADTFEVKARVNADNTLPSEIVYSLMMDSDNGLWFSSHSGLHRFSTVDGALKNYRYGQEISVSEFNEGAVTMLADGRMAYGSTNGVVLFDPAKLYDRNQQRDTARQMVITGFKLDSRNDLQLPRENLSGEKVVLEHDDYGISILFSPMLMSKKSDANYQYSLYRGDALVSEGDTRDPRIIFATLTPGEYTFSVEPTTNSFDDTYLPADISIFVPYAPWRSPLAYTSYVVLLLLIVLSYFYARHQQLNRLQRAQQQVRLFGDAFRQTRDWVVIFDSSQKPVAINRAFAVAFGINDSGNIDRSFKQLFQRYPKLARQLSGRLSSLKPGQFWKDDDVVEGADGKQYDVLIEITAISDPDNKALTDHYLLVISDISEQKNAERKLIKIANYDSLTGLVNRSLLLDRLEHAVDSARENDTKVAVLFVDLDRFKGINDSLGHDYGDKLLRVVANRMRNLASGADTVARLGGDEFVIVMEDVKQVDELSHFVGELIESVETPISLGKEILRVSCSVGVSFYPDDAEEPAELLKHADVAMYSAKKDTLNAFTYFTTEMNQRARDRLHVENLVKRAYTEDCFYNHYQPIINTRTGKTEGVELLLRCQLPEQPLYPDMFIPVLEELRYIIETTRQAMRRAVADLADWYAIGFDGYISVNLSALHFKTEFDIAGVKDLLAEYALPVTSLRFEITEGVLMDNTGNALTEIQRFVDEGFVLALDDFGTGYSSLSYLKRYPLKVLKIDKSFVDDIQPGNANDALVSTTITLSERLSMVSIAEGVETLEQAQYLAELGCHYQQGYYFSRPVAGAEVPELLTRQWTISS